MKTSLLCLLFFLVSLSLFSQIPQGFNYQAIARDGSGNPITGATINVKLSVLSDSTGFYPSGDGTYLYEEQHTGVKTNAFGLFTIVLGKGTYCYGPVTTFSAVNWSVPNLFIGTKIDNGGWKVMGQAKLWTVPYAMVSSKADGLTSGSKLAVVSADDALPDALFEVKRKDGQTVFAVYSDAVNVFVPETTVKGKKGGFAVGGFDKIKGISQDFFTVTSDSIRMYINNNPPGKSSTKGGFAIGGFGTAKGARQKYLSLYGASTIDTISNASQILWYPNKEAFLAGRINIVHPDSVGRNSFSTGYKTKAIGNYSHAMGYESIARGDYSTAIGRSAISEINSFALGNFSKALGNDSYAIGSGSVASAPGSFALGVQSKATGNVSVSLGFNSNATQPYSVAIGYFAKATGFDSYAIGSQAEANGDKSFAIGSYGLNEDGTVNTNRATWTEGFYSLAFGMGAQATKVGAMALGVNATAAGDKSVSIGFGTNATGQFSTAMGYRSIANGFKSIAIGAHYHLTFNKLVWQFNPAAQRWILVPEEVELDRANIADGEFSIAIGNGNNSKKGGLSLGTNNDALAFGSVAIGHSNVADSAFSFVAGFNNTATGVKAFALGENLTSSSAGSFVIGAFNLIEGSQNEWIPTDPLFVIGNGNPLSRSNAFKVLKDGNIILKPGLMEGNGTPLVLGGDGALMKLASSERYKYDINNLEDITWLYDFRPVSFIYKNDPDKAIQYGLVAEDVEKINSNFVFYLDGKPDGVNYNGLFAPVIKALQEQKTMIDILTRQNNILTKENTEMKQRLESLEKTVSTIMTEKK